MNTDAGKILVVDDSEDIRFLVTTLLHSLGYETIEAENGVRALELLDFDPRIRLVITDYDMPEMDGLELTRRIRRDERLEDLPVLMQSAGLMDCLESRSVSAGVTRLLPKPISTDLLRRQVESIMSGSGPDHIWRALLIGLPAESASTVLSTLSDAGFQVLQAHDEAQARMLLQKIDGIDLVFVNHQHPDYGQFVRAHLLRNEKDFYLFRLVLLMGATVPKSRVPGGTVCVAGYLMNPISPEKVTAMLRRLGLDSIRNAQRSPSEL
jgi:two-component system chemotaxis response regulator CheY